VGNDMKFKAIIFDLDGTLLDSLADIADAVNAVLGSLQYPPHPLESYKYFVGDGMDTLARRVIPAEFCSEQIITKFINSVKDEYATRWNHTTKPYPGIPELLTTLTRLGVKLAVLSNKPHEFTQMMVSRLFPEWRFDAVYGARPEVKKKPDPAAALEIAARLCLQPAQIVYLGDSGTDMQTALAAGMYGIGALWGFRDAHELYEAGAMDLVKYPLELVDFF
jgi:phosphoglycolate phosphatase